LYPTNVYPVAIFGADHDIATSVGFVPHTPGVVVTAAGFGASYTDSVKVAERLNETSLFATFETTVPVYRPYGVAESTCRVNADDAVGVAVDGLKFKKFIPVPSMFPSTFTPSEFNI
jgi:hypothetical protein